MSIIQKRIAELAKRHGGIAALSRQTGIPRTSLNSYIKGSEPSVSVANKIAEECEVSFQWLTGIDMSKKGLTIEDITMIPDAIISAMKSRKMAVDSRKLMLLAIMVFRSCDGPDDIRPQAERLADKLLQLLESEHMDDIQELDAVNL